MLRHKYLRLLLQNNLSLNQLEYELIDTATQGMACHFVGMQLSSTFHPVLLADGQLAGREAKLAAYVPGLGNISSEAAFDRAIAEDRLVQFDRLVRTIHLLNHAHSEAGHQQLFLNVHPRLLNSVSDHGRTFEKILHYYSVPTTQVVIGIVASAVKDGLENAVQNYRNLGYQIAIDNSGSGTLEKLFHQRPGFDQQGSLDSLAWFNRVLDLRPDFVKLDDIRTGGLASQLVLKRLIDLLQGVGAKVVLQNLAAHYPLEEILAQGLSQAELSLT